MEKQIAFSKTLLIFVPIFLDTSGKVSWIRTGVNKPLLASGERSFHARLRTPVDPDGISFSTDLAGPCRLLIRNSIPRITLPAALLRLGIASATNLVTPGRDALVLLSRSNYPLVRRVFIPSAHLSLGSVDHGVNAGNLENFLLLSCFYFFLYHYSWKCLGSEIFFRFEFIISNVVCN